MKLFFFKLRELQTRFCSHFPKSLKLKKKTTTRNLSLTFCEKNKRYKSDVIGENL